MSGEFPGTGRKVVTQILWFSAVYGVVRWVTPGTYADRLRTHKWDGTVNIVISLARGLATRPSDASNGKLFEGTATDWVTRGHLPLVIFRLFEA